MTWLGYRVMAFEYDADVISGGQPQKMLDTADELTRLIKADMKGRKVAGIYGVSLGSYFGFNLMIRTGINRTILNTGPASLVGIVWDPPAYEVTRQRYLKNGYDRAALAKAWSPMEAESLLDWPEDPRLLCMNSKGDQVVTYDNVTRTKKIVKSYGVKLSEVTSRRPGHAGAIVRNMLRIWRTKRFYSAK
jgi:predicted esterase YcpF (UPF0227 family)